MRLSKLDLIRYGKFTDLSVELPQREFDFHFVTGPNEAGKSTLRTAILELLFGMPHRATMGFLHDQKELLVGATVEDARQSLTFRRRKANRQTLRTPTDTVLSDDALAPFLGNIDEQLFQQMFCLDHPRLVQGGQAILDASGNVGQMLFQSAAGIASLGRVRQDLEDEGGKLWGPRAAKDRAYYKAKEQFDAACAQLKTATVRTTAWTQARRTVQEAEEQVRDAEAQVQTLDTELARLERIRRVAPSLAKMRSIARELQELGDVLDLPPDAQSTLDGCVTGLTSARTAVSIHRSKVDALETEVGKLVRDDAILALESQVQELEAHRHRCASHIVDVADQRRQVEQLLASVQDLCGQLGWPRDEAQIRAALPSRLDLRRVGDLVKARGAVEQATEAAEQAVREQAVTLEALQSDLEEIPAHQAGADLRSALVQAQAVRNSPATQRTLHAAVEHARAALDDALKSLTPWSPSLVELRNLPCPTAERASELREQQRQLETAVLQARQRLEEANEVVAAKSLELEQFTRDRRVVTETDVAEARRHRDGTWAEIKAGRLALDSGARTLEEGVVLADELADARLASADDAATLRSLRQQLEAATAAASRLQAALELRTGELRDFLARWEEQAATLGLKGMRLEDLREWLARRDRALAAATALTNSEQQLEIEVAAYSAAHSELLRCMQRSALPIIEGEPLTAAAGRVERFITDADTADTRRTLLGGQIKAARRALAQRQEDARQARLARDQWQQDWKATLADIGLDGHAESVGEAEAAVEMAARVMELLDRIEATRADRIRPMEADLEHFDKRVRHVAREAGEDVPSQARPEEVAKRLAERLSQALAAKADRVRKELELETARRHLESAQHDMAVQEAHLAPLLKQAGVDDVDAARLLVQRSDCKRRLEAALASARNEVLQGGDGLDMDAVVAEVDACNATEVVAAVARTKDQLAQLRIHYQGLLERRQDARRALDEIAGQADAAMAEAKRQEALAEMAQASERYLKVATATKLLRWAIERYRDRKQGPMLQRAEQVFAGLTLGEFTRLVVDFDDKAPTLVRQPAQRSRGRRGRHERRHARPALLGSAHRRAGTAPAQRHAPALHRRRPVHQLRRCPRQGRSGGAARAVTPHAGDFSHAS